LLADFVAKLDEEQVVRNIRIEAREFLNQHYAVTLGLESMLRAGPLKIVLQQNQPEAAQIDVRLNVGCWGVSGLIMLTPSSSLLDPELPFIPPGS
jgi:hypothetical protein